MLGDRETVVTEVKPFDLHGLTCYDLVLIFSDGSTQSARLGPGACAPKAQGRDRVLVKIAANRVVSLPRP